MNRNTRHLLGYWGIAAVFGSLIMVGSVASVLRGDYTAPCAVAVALVLALGLGWYRRRKLRGLLKNETAAPSVLHFKKNLSSAPHGRAISAALCGLVLAMYGEFDEARDELSTVSWNGVPPIYEGMRTQTLAVLALLQEKDYRKASELASEMRDLVAVSTTMPGSKTTRRGADAFCDACDLLAGLGTNETVKRLEDVVVKLRPLDAPLTAWALAEYYRRVGDAKGAQKYVAMVRELAPHCAPLTK